MLHDIPQDMPTDSSSNNPAGSGQLARQQAIKQIERKRRFWAGTVAAAVGMIVLWLSTMITTTRAAGRSTDSAELWPP
jgi:hypothetical protein